MKSCLPLKWHGFIHRGKAISRLWGIESAFVVAMNPKEKLMFPRKKKLVLFLTLAPGCIGCITPEIAFAQQASALPVEDVLRERSFAQLSSIEFSPDGKWLVYGVEGQEEAKPNEKEPEPRRVVSEYVRGENVWLLNIETGEARNLTSGKGKNWHPTWSPDGRFLAFLSDREGGGRALMWIWDATKDALNKVPDIDVDTWQPMKWTPDSRSIFVTVKPQRLSAGASEKRKESDTEPEKPAGQKEQGPTLHLYQSSFTGPRGREGPQSDPWDLNRFLRDLVKVDVVTGQTRVLVHNQRIQAYKISSDSSRVAYAVEKRFEKPGSQQLLYDLVVLALSTMKERVVAADVRLSDGDFSWSPDMQLISYQPDGPEEKIRDCYIVNAEGGPPQNISKFLPLQQSRRGYSSVPLWDRSGHYTYFLHDGALWRASVSEGKAWQIARIPNHQINLSISQSHDLLWTDGGNSTVIVAHDDVGKQDAFYRINLENGESVKLVENGECYTCTAMQRPIAVARNGKQLAYAAEDAKRDSDLWLNDATFKHPRRLTHLNPQFDNYKLGAARLIDWLSDDGERLRGALLLPSDYQEGKRYPLVVCVYGGAHLSESFDLFGLNSNAAVHPQLLATRGYAVLLPDSPAHEGTPMADLAKTVLPGVNKVIEMGIADPERLGVMGHSNGGYSTLALIVQTKRFKAAVSVDGMGDLVATYGGMKKDGAAFGTSLESSQDAMGGTPWQVRERYIENSPFFYLDRVQTPLLIVHVAGDPVVPSFLGDQIFVSLRRLGKEVEYAKYDGESHAPRGFVNQVDHINRMLAWFEKYLQPN